jgi:hypothetical protein
MFGDLLPMHYDWVNAGTISQGGGRYVITMNTSTNFTVDSNYQNTTKNDYVLSFTAVLDNIANAVTNLGSLAKIITWVRLS